MVYFILALIAVILIEALVIVILGLVLKRRTVKKIDTFNQTVEHKYIDLAEADRLTAKKKEKLDADIKQALSIDDIKLIFSRLNK